MLKHIQQQSHLADVIMEINTYSLDCLTCLQYQHVATKMLMYVTKELNF